MFYYVVRVNSRKCQLGSWTPIPMSVEWKSTIDIEAEDPSSNRALYTVGATSERTAAGKTEKLIFRAFFSSKM